jgi:molybdenum cofactor cytidylyltransferase
MRVAAVVLAAGKSERMGRNKLLLKLRDKTLLDLILDALVASKVDEIIVVLGNKSWEIADVIKPRLNRIRMVVNERYEEGMTSSFKTGLKRIEHADAAILVLGDQLILDPKFLDVMIEQMERNKGKALIVSPIYKGKKGHPFLLSKELFNEILSLNESEVIRDVIHRHIDKLLTIEGARWTIMDIDTPKDFTEAIRLLEENTLSSGRKQD